MLENVIDTVELCRFCLMCRHVAPVGHVTHQEALTPHGIALTVSSQRRGVLGWDEETAAIPFSEVDGGNSRAHCVNGLPFEEAIAAARANLVAQQLAPAAIYDVQQQLESYETPFAEQAPQPASGAGETALFIGDAAHLWPKAVENALHLLNAVGIEPVKVGVGRSSGLLAQSLGLPTIGQKLAQATLDEIVEAGVRRLLVLSAEDFYFFTQGMGERLGLERPSELEVVEVTTLLADKLADGALSVNGVADDVPTAYLDPTHAVRVPTRHERVRGLVSAVFPTQLRELFWRKERAHPVGSTHLQFSNPAVAEQLTHARLADAQQQGVVRLVCEDPATLHQLEKYAAHYDELRVHGLYAWLADHIS